MHAHARAVVLAAAAFVGLAATPSATQPGGKAEPDPFTAEFLVEPSELTNTGRNPYFILEPGYTLEYEGGDERLVITVLDETEIVDGVGTRVVEEREWKDDELVEVSRNFFAMSTRTNGVYYFGEDVEIYEDGELVAREGEWRSGVDGARFGLMIPGEPLLGARHYQEQAPGAAMDRAEVVALDAALTTPAGEFARCLVVRETTPLEPGAEEYKRYARGVGLIQDGGMKLVRYGVRPGGAP